MSLPLSAIAEASSNSYWKKYDWARPFADEDERLNPTADPSREYRQYLPLDPTHPRAWIPPYVRWAKRKQVNFQCPITGWKETDWFRGIQGGPYRRVGVLTMDHILPGAKGGLTTDENLRALSSLANTKKGHREISDEQLRLNILSAYKVVFMPEDLLKVLTEYNITQYKVGT